jgi:hypothetical protein
VMRGLMIRLRLAARLTLTLSAISLAPFAVTTTRADEARTVRPEVGVPLQRAAELLSRGKPAEAAAQLREATSAGGNTAYEDLVIEQVRGSIARAAGDNAAAARSYEAQLATGRLPAAEQMSLVVALASMAYQASDYPRTVTWTTRYFQLGGDDKAMRALLIQAYFLEGNYADAAKAQAEQIDTDGKAGRTPDESQLQLLAACQTRLKDDTGLTATIETLVTDYPKADYWKPLIHGVQVKPGFAAGRLALDLDRFALAAGTLATSAQYLEMAQRALAAGIAGEAKSILDKGYAAGILGTGPEAPREQRLKDLVTKTIMDDQNGLLTGVPEAATRDANALFATGAKLAGYGQFDKGIPAMEQALDRGGMKRLDDAKLHLGLAYLAAGRKAKALGVLKSVTGADGTADLAHLWVLQIGKS